MSEENFCRLDCDDDIVMLEKDTFTVARLKELLSHNLKEYIEKTGQQIGRDGRQRNIAIAHDKNVASISYLLYQLCWLPITDKSLKLDLSNILLIFPPNGIECKLLELESRKWIEGKMRIQCNLQINAYNSAEVKLELEFSPDESNLTEESVNEERLDDLRSKLNQLNEM